MSRDAVTFGLLVVVLLQGLWLVRRPSAAVEPVQELRCPAPMWLDGWRGVRGLDCRRSDETHAGRLARLGLGGCPVGPEGLVVVTRAADHGCRITRLSGRAMLALGLPLDPNEASAADLEALPGIGPSLARRVIEHRERHGGFHRLEDLLAVSGIGPKLLSRIGPHLEVAK